LSNCNETKKISVHWHRFGTVLLCCSCSCSSWGDIRQNTALLVQFHHAFIILHHGAHAALPDSLDRQPCPAASPGSLAKQPCPAALPGSLPRKPSPAALPGSLARQPSPAALPCSFARQLCPAV
jgi:hypothetical protein